MLCFIKKTQNCIHFLLGVNDGRDVFGCCIARLYITKYTPPHPDNPACTFQNPNDNTKSTYKRKYDPRSVPLSPKLPLQDDTDYNRDTATKSSLRFISRKENGRFVKVNITKMQMYGDLGNANDIQYFDSC